MTASNGRVALWLMAFLWLLAGKVIPADHPDPDHSARYRFDLGPGPVAEGYRPVRPDSLYDEGLGYGFHDTAGIKGFDHAGANALSVDGCTGEQPFYFSVRLPEGNYRVRLVLGHREQASRTTIKAEQRRLMLEERETAAGEALETIIAVNIRTPLIDETRSVRLKQRERDQEMIQWDDRLTLEFNGAHPAVCAVEIEPAPELPTVFLLGDSTVTDQAGEPWNSWGQMLPRFLEPEVTVANYANSGESLRSSLHANRFAKVYALMRPGDYAMVQFGHNDMKSKQPDALAQYETDLREFVRETRQRGGSPVLITSMERKAGMKAPTLQEYPDAVRKVAAEEEVTLIDLNRASVTLYQALGEDLDRAFQDGTHHTGYGSYLLAKCVAAGLKQSDLKLSEWVVDELVGFDPAHPDPYESFKVPPSRTAIPETPLGN